MSARYCDRHDSWNCADCRDEAQEQARKWELERAEIREHVWIGYCDLCNGQHCVTIKAADAKVGRISHIHPEVRATIRERDALWAARIALVRSEAVLAAAEAAHNQVVAAMLGGVPPLTEVGRRIEEAISSLLNAPLRAWPEESIFRAEKKLP